MRKTLLMAAVLALAACGPKQGETGAADTTGAMTPAPGAMADSTAMSHDSMGMSDTTMMRDSAKR